MNTCRRRGIARCGQSATQRHLRSENARGTARAPAKPIVYRPRCQPRRPTFTGSCRSLFPQAFSYFLSDGGMPWLCHCELLNKEGYRELWRGERLPPHRRAPWTCALIYQTLSSTHLCECDRGGSLTKSWSRDARRAYSPAFAGSSWAHCLCAFSRWRCTAKRRRKVCIVTRQPTHLLCEHPVCCTNLPALCHPFP